MSAARPAGLVRPLRIACAVGLRTKAMSCVRGSAMSATKLPAPSRCRASSLRRRRAPIHPLAEPAPSARPPRGGSCDSVGLAEAVDQRAAEEEFLVQLKILGGTAEIIEMLLSYHGVFFTQLAFVAD
jgi:hypothetical protein